MMQFYADLEYATRGQTLSGEIQWSSEPLMPYSELAFGRTFPMPISTNSRRREDVPQIPRRPCGNAFEQTLPATQDDYLRGGNCFWLRA